MVNIYEMVDVMVATMLLINNIRAPTILVYFCISILLLRTLMAHVFIPAPIPFFVLYGVSVLSALLLLLSDIIQPAKIGFSLALLYRAFRDMIVNILSADDESDK